MAVPGISVMCDVHGRGDGYVASWPGPRLLVFHLCIACREDEAVVLLPHGHVPTSSVESENAEEGAR